MRRTLGLGASILSSIAVLADGFGAERRPAAPRGLGKAAQAQIEAARVEPSYHHISRQVRRREQRKALKRMGAI